MKKKSCKYYEHALSKFCFCCNLPHAPTFYAPPVHCIPAFDLLDVMSDVRRRAFDDIANIKTSIVINVFSHMRACAREEIVN